MCEHPLLIVLIVLLTTGIGLYFICKWIFMRDLDIDMQDLREDLSDT